MSRKCDSELFENGQAEANGTATAKPPAPKPSNPFDLSALRLSQDFVTNVGGEKLLTIVPVRKPNKEHWSRVHPGEDYRLDTLILELKEESESYLLAKSLHELYGSEPTIRAVTIFTAIARNGDAFLWPIPLPSPDGKDNDWHRSAREAARLAMERWVRVTSSRSLGAYETTITRAELPEPNWPNKSFQELIDIAFRDRMIDSIDHPVLKRLRGEA